MLEIGKINKAISLVIESLKKSGRIDDSFVNRFYSSFEQPTLQIGIVGKMKAGKSTLANALFFEDDILPSGSEPTTVTLTKIQYGDKNISTIELLSEQDIEVVKNNAAYIGDNEYLLTLKNNAQELIDALPVDYLEHVGKSFENIPNSELSAYVAADGQYCSLVKSVSIQINNINLKGITIIDTPGFNDPIVSRGETTRQFLTECHAILFVHDCDGYDETDAELLTNQIEYAGVSCLVDIFNKMDMRRRLILSEWDDKVCDFIEDRENYIDESTHPNVYSLIEKSIAVPVSAFMALCGMKPIESRTNFIRTKISEFEERYVELTADDNKSIEEALVKYSNIDKIKVILNKLSEEGKQYLIEKPINTLKGKLRAIIEQIQSDIEIVKSNFNLLSQDRKTALSDIENLKDFMKSIKVSISTSPLEVILLDKVAETRKHIQTQRETEANSLTKEVLPEPGFFDSGITKANIAAYNTFLSRFQSILRGDLESLSRNLESATNEYIRKTILSLVNPKVSEQRRENFEANAKNKAKSKIQNINIVIDAFSLSSLPDDKAEQWSILKTNFLKYYDDKFIDSLLLSFREVSSDIGTPTFITNILLEMEEDMTSLLSKTPVEIEMKIKEAEEQIERLNNELKYAQEQFNKLENIQ